MGDQYEYKKTVPIQGIDTNTEKQYSFKKKYKYKFQTLHNHQEKNDSHIIKQVSKQPRKHTSKQS